MRVKVNGKWHDGNEEPIVVELNDVDKKNIADMHPQATKYGQFPDTMTRAERFAFMEADDPLVRVLHCYKPDVKRDPSQEGKPNIFNHTLGQDLDKLIGQRWDIVHVHGFDHISSFIEQYHEDYQMIDRRIDPDGPGFKVTPN